MKIEKNISLRPYNTFGFHATADNLFQLERQNDLGKIFDLFQNPLIIGGGSNILLSRPRYEAVVINRISGIKIIENHQDRVLVRIGSGENWHEFVQWAIAQNFGGVENLSLIPGTAGAAPIQNIGAYGVELKEILHGLDYFRFHDNQQLFIPPQDCKFGYRDSIFKNEWKGKGLISHIYIWLTKPPHSVNIEYKALLDHLSLMKINKPNIRQVSEAVIAVRQSKLPDWKILGNAGSFFKNPVISKEVFEKLKAAYPQVPHYPVNASEVKIPAAWLIQEAGFKGKRRGQAGSYQHQPLVLVNYGAEKADDLLNLKKEIQTEVTERFGICLHPEVTIL